ncbi:hypothetical protein AMTR_s00023p00136780 [Amborella trichopoda]|uniref:AMP-dependent synthetase/ligase domain-containing protein n=1 Tax=Amborella trichopoda TaxID=13333 RepID=W1NJB0_AMBTC|nr:hypothetical protein AMTR_s00023p00136780 [Amborella trichopoda]
MGPRPSCIDPKSGFCRDKGTFYSLRPTPNLTPLDLTSYIFSLIPNPPPSSPALVDVSAKSLISYGDLRSMVSSLSFSLQSEFAIQKGDGVFILSPSSIYIPIISLSSLSLGAIVSPSNPINTKSEIEHQIQISKPALIFAHSSAAHKIPAQNRVISIDSLEFRRLIESPRSSPERVTIDPDDPASILYSSGTTGRVKGVIWTQRNYTAMLAELLSLRIEKRTCSFITVPLFHAYGFAVCLKGLAFGETVVLTGEGMFEVRFVCRAVEEWRVTHLVAAPLVLAAMSTGEEAKGFDLGSLEAVIIGGAPLGKEMITRFKRRFPWVIVAQGCDRLVARLIGPALKREGMSYKMWPEDQPGPGQHSPTAGQPSPALPCPAWSCTLPFGQVQARARPALLRQAPTVAGSSYTHYFFYSVKLYTVLSLPSISLSMDS